MLKFTLPYAHPFKDKLYGMTRFIGGRPMLVLHSRKDDVMRDHRLSVYRDGRHIMTVWDNRAGDMRPGMFELLSCGLEGDTLELQERGTLGQVAAFLSEYQQTGDVTLALEAFYEYDL